MHRHSYVILFATFSLLACLGCKNQGFFLLGDSTDLVITNSLPVADPVTGITFTMATNGTPGTLTVTELRLAPPRPFAGGAGWQFEFSSNTPLTITVPLAEGEQVRVLAWGDRFGSYDARGDGQAWIPLAPYFQSSTEAYYQLMLPNENVPPLIFRTNGFAALSDNATNTAGCSRYWICKNTPTTAEIERRQNISLQVSQNIDTVINALPADVQTRATANRSRLLYSIFDGAENGYSAYERHRLYNVLRPMFELVQNPTPGNIAHEVGHYITHVLDGDKRYLALEDTALTVHGIGEEHPGRGIIIEDLAYFVQRFLLGELESLTYPRQVLAYVNRTAVDMPSVEGFAAVLLGMLCNAKTSMQSYITRKMEPVPAIGASFGEIMRLYETAPDNMNDLRTQIEAFLAGRGQAAALPVVAERIGWSYAGLGRIVDENGAPVAGVEVTNIAIVGTDTYYLYDDRGNTLTRTTGPDGTFFLTRIFPGTTVLRLTKGDTSIDVQATVDWSNSTNKLVDLGSLAFSNTIRKPSRCAISLVALWTFASPGCAKSLYSSVGIPITVGHDMHVKDEDLAWENAIYSFSGDTLTGTWTQGNLTIKFSPSRDKVLEFSGEGVDRFASDKYYSIAGTEVPLAEVDEVYHWAYYRITGTGACAPVTAASLRVPYNIDNPECTSTEFSCTPYAMMDEAYLEVSCITP